ncbi:MAG: PD-(D/E)XK nuclease family protein [Planctomycetota bacterium]|jgi:RecB family exonuclease|nr:PD-(D/E)XK nuclease family protein [Planctomycetota bacterium]
MLPARRVFLGWDRAPLEAAVEWLAGEDERGAEGSLLALPGAGAVRALEERLAAAGQGRLAEAEVVTVGHLPDRLLELPAPAASRLVRTRAWERALRQLPAEAISALVAHPPEDGEHRAWRGLAETARKVFGQLAAECLDFAAVLDGPLAAGKRGERGRWKALVQAQGTYEHLLARADLCDPHLGRLAALAAGHGSTSGPAVVLVGVAEMGGLQRRLLEGRVAVSALIFAPEELEDGFDALGCVRPQPWLEREWALPLERWQVAEGPDAQARLAMDVIARWEGRFSPEEITIGVADDEIVPFLEGRLAEEAVFARPAAGMPIRHTAPARLLEATGTVLASGRYEDLACLLRHPDLERRLVAALGEQAGSTPLAELLDRYHAEHLPGEIPARWLATGERGSAEVASALASVARGLDHLMGPLTGAARPLAAWAEPLRAFLDQVYGARSLDPAEECDRRLAVALASLGRALERAEGVPRDLDGDLPAAEAVAVVLAEAGGTPLPARPPAAGEPAIELAGWLELPLDQAPALVLCGFNEGRLPAAVETDGWLPDGLRSELGLPDDARRLARDRYLLEAIVRSRAEALFIGGRRSASGEALLPSRLALAGAAGELTARLRHGLRAVEEPRPAVAFERVDTGLAAVRGLAPPERWSASSFARYLRSPYEFALHLAGLETLDDRARELDPLGFGIAAHEVLQRFGVGEAARSTDPREVRAACREALEAVFDQRFGPRPQAAVLLQRRQLAWRLDLFAEVQARRAAEGWRIEHCEWSPQDVILDVDGEPVELVGRIDRIDRHVDGRWAVLDYKTGEKGVTADGEHRKKDGRWLSLQLPLYALMARDLVGEEVEPAFFQLGSTERSVKLSRLASWSAEYLAEALDQARDIVREVRALLAGGAPFPEGEARLGDPIRCAVFGRGLIGAGEGDDEEDDG